MLELLNSEKEKAQKYMQIGSVAETSGAWYQIILLYNLFLWILLDTVRRTTVFNFTYWNYCFCIEKLQAFFR